MTSTFTMLQRRQVFLICLGAIALIICLIASPDADAKLFDGPVDKLPVLERVALREGKVTLAGEEGKYTGRMLVEASRDTAWQVLTDYEGFDNFLPNVDSSRLLETNGDRKVFEQISTIKTLIFKTEARVRLAITESYPQQIQFEAIAGDFKTLNGSWLLEPVSPYPSAPPNSVLITHRVEVKPASSPANSFFYGIYEDSLEKSLAAIKAETEKRSARAQK
ncbi:SRPBCC family protein [Myxosarcina sp. GI1(2024)]